MVAQEGFGSVQRQLVHHQRKRDKQNIEASQGQQETVQISKIPKQTNNHENAGRHMDLQQQLP